MYQKKVHSALVAPAGMEKSRIASWVVLLTPPSCSEKLPWPAAGDATRDEPERVQPSVPASKVELAVVQVPGSIGVPE
jgi:hypothetical protein